MILNAIIHSKYHYADTWSGMSALIAEVMDNLKSEHSNGMWSDPGENACFIFADGRYSDDDGGLWADNFLYVAVNSSTGYGGLTWLVTRERARKSEYRTADHVWVSDNPAPPDFDPRVVADPGGPVFYDPRSALPASQIRAALEEFCRTGTGDRPECVSWVLGETTGGRLG